MNKFEHGIEMISNGTPVQEVVEQVYGMNFEEIREKVEEVKASTKILAAKHVGKTVCDSILDEIKEKDPDDISTQYKKIAIIKYNCSMWNLDLGATELRDEQSMDLNYMKSFYEKTLEAELEMAKDATEEELEALKTELADVLPDDMTEMYETLKKNVSPEIAEAMNKLQADPELSDQVQDTIAILMTAAIMDTKKVSDEEAASAAYVYGAVSVGNKKSIVDSFLFFIDKVYNVICISTTVSFGLGIIAEILGLSALAESMLCISFACALGFCAVACISCTVIIGKGLVNLGKKLWPKVKPAVMKVVEAYNNYLKPIIVKYAKKATVAVMHIYGLFINKVFHPTVEWVKDKVTIAADWVKDKAIPAVLVQYEHLKRRLAKIKDWLIEKKDQFVSFMRKAKENAAEKVAESIEKVREFAKENVVEDEPVILRNPEEFQDEDEDNFEPAYN